MGQGQFVLASIRQLQLEGKDETYVDKIGQLLWVLLLYSAIAAGLVCPRIAALSASSLFLCGILMSYFRTLDYGRRHAFSKYFVVVAVGHLIEHEAVNSSGGSGGATGSGRKLRKQRGKEGARDPSEPPTLSSNPYQVVTRLGIRQC